MTAIDSVSGVPPASQRVEQYGMTKTAGEAGGQGQTRSFGFGDFIDVINPLQHIPGIAEIYRSITNDQISDEARKKGNAIYGLMLGGPVGLGVMMVYNVITGRPSEEAGAATAIGAVSKEGNAVEVAGPQGSIPVPEPKPANQNETETRQSGNVREVLGENIGTTRVSANEPLDLLAMIASVQSSDDNFKKSNTDATAASGSMFSSIAYVEETGDGGQPDVVASDDGLKRLATHTSNHLPLDVLKALQERHAERTSSERS